MKLTDITIDNFGVCQNLDFQDISGEILLIFGPNEAGKTTTMDFIRDTLFGPSTETHRRLQANGHHQPGGRIRTIDPEGNLWDIRRIYGDEPELEISINSQLHPASSLSRDLLGGIGPDIFHNVFTIGLAELRQLNQLNATEAADFLYEMTTGFDRVSLGNILRQISRTRMSILDEQGKGELTLLRDKQNTINSKLQLAKDRLAEWTTCQNSLLSTEEELDTLQDRREELKRELTTNEVCLRVYDRVQELDRLKIWMIANQHAATLSGDDIFNRLDLLVQDAKEGERLNAQIREHDVLLLELQDEQAGLVNNLIPQELWLRTRAFSEMAPWIRSLREQLAEFDDEPLDIRRNTKPRSGVHLDDDVDHSLLDQRLLKDLRNPAKQLKQSNKRLQQATMDGEELEQRLTESETAWLNDSTWDTVDSVPNLASPVIGITDEYTCCKRSINELRKRINQAQEDARVTPSPPDYYEATRDLGNLLICGIIFSTGGTLLGMGLLFPSTFGLSTGAAIFCALVGLLAIAGGVLGQMRESEKRKRLLERKARAKELELTRTPDPQSKLADSEPLLEQLQPQLQSELKKLTEITKLRKQAATIERLRVSRQASKDRIHNLSNLVEEAEADWFGHLQQAGIHANLTPLELYEAVEQVDQFHTNHIKQLDQQSLLRRRKTELAEMEERLNALLREIPDNIQPFGLDDKLEMLTSITSQQQALRAEKSRLDEEVESIRERLTRWGTDSATLTRGLVNQYARVGVKDLNGLHELHKSVTKLRDNSLRHDELLSDLQSTAEQQEIPLEVFMEIAQLPQPEIENKWANTDLFLEETNKHINSVHEDLGKLRAKSEDLGRQEDLSLYRFKVAAIQSEIQTLEERWRVWSTSEDISQRVRSLYETQRQPETLRDASQWLEEITAGRYVRLWTPLGEDLLYVDDAMGQSWVIDTLSRGTRESVYLSLRLALVRSYQQDGVSLPLILDDVFVNLDFSRLKTAISAIKRFSVEVGQVLFFTCHAHIATLFEEMDADIRPIERPEEIRAPDLPRLAYVNQPSGITKAKASTSNSADSTGATPVKADLLEPSVDGTLRNRTDLREEHDENDGSIDDRCSKEDQNDRDIAA